MANRRGGAANVPSGFILSLGKPFSCGPSNIHATHWHAR
jgi:hypothetical protein